MCGLTVTTVRSAQPLEASSCLAEGEYNKYTHDPKLMLLSCFYFLLFFVVFLFVCFLPSDGTLNPSGVRFGSAEIYNIGELIYQGGTKFEREK